VGVSVLIRTIVQSYDESVDGTGGTANNGKSSNSSSYSSTASAATRLTRTYNSISTPIAMNTCSCCTAISIHNKYDNNTTVQFSLERGER
jgi:hypothetical protein